MNQGFVSACSLSCNSFPSFRFVAQCSMVTRHTCTQGWNGKFFQGALNFTSFGPKILNCSKGEPRFFFFFCSPWLRPCMHSIYKFEKEDTYKARISLIGENSMAAYMITFACKKCPYIEPKHSFLTKNQNSQTKPYSSIVHFYFSSTRYNY